MRFALLLASATLFSCGASSPHIEPFPEACGTCPLDDASAPPPLPKAFASDGLLGARFIELSATLDSHITLTNGEPHVHSGVGFETAIPITRDDRVRFIVNGDVTGGAWGDQQHGELMFEHSLGFRVSLASDPTIIDPYLYVTDGIIFGVGRLPTGQSFAPGNVLGGGLGLRIFRSFSLELTAHWDYSLDRPFVALHDGSTTSSLVDFGAGFRFDFCSLGAGCTRKAPQRGATDVTCALYADATNICASAQRANKRADLCQHAVQAMALSDTQGPVLARESVTKFLGNLVTAEGNVPWAGDETALGTTNSCLLNWRTCGRHQECLLGQQGKSVEMRRIYSPYVLEVLQALGCNADGSVTPQCDYKCEDATPPPKPQICGGR